MSNYTCGTDTVSKSFSQELKARLTESTDGATVGGIFVDEFDTGLNSVIDLVQSIDGIVMDKDGSKYSGLLWVAIRFVSENCYIQYFAGKHK